jgi:parvulin-like peptidyl-prolyl isomerase
VSDIIKTEDAWYIIKVEDRKPETQLSFEEVKNKLKKKFETERARELKEKWITDLRAKAKIEVLLGTEKSIPVSIGFSLFPSRQRCSSYLG